MITWCDDLHVAATETNRRIDHIIVGAELERQHENEQSRGKNDGKNGQHRPSRIAPNVAPGHQHIVHHSLFLLFRLARVNILSSISISNSRVTYSSRVNLSSSSARRMVQLLGKIRPEKSSIFSAVISLTNTI